jgi:hypothetical protein
VAAIAPGSFALVFSEVIPVGLLSDIGGHLRASVGTGGLMVVPSPQQSPRTQAAEAHYQLESGTVHERTILAL